MPTRSDGVDLAAPGMAGCPDGAGASERCGSVRGGRGAGTSSSRCTRARWRASRTMRSAVSSGARAEGNHQPVSDQRREAGVGETGRAASSAGSPRARTNPLTIILLSSSPSSRHHQAVRRLGSDHARDDVSVPVGRQSYVSASPPWPVRGRSGRSGDRHGHARPARRATSGARPSGGRRGRARPHVPAGGVGRGYGAEQWCGVRSSGRRPVEPGPARSSGPGWECGLGPLPCHEAFMTGWPESRGHDGRHR